MAKKTKTKRITRKAVVDEINKSILLKDEEKEFWLSKINSLPTAVLKGVYEAVKGKNELMGEYLNAAFESDPDQNYVKQLKQKIKKIKNDTLKIEEDKQSQDAEQLLTAELDKL